MSEQFGCPRCSCRHSRTLETRKVTFRGCYMIMRTRLCRHCGKHYRTKEINEPEIRDTSNNTTQVEKEEDFTIPEPENGNSEKKDSPLDMEIP